MEERERAVLVGLAVGGTPLRVVESHLRELGQLVATAGGEAVGRLVQERKAPDPAFFVGRGKVAELAGLVEKEHAGLVVFDDDLSPLFLAVVESTEEAVLDSLFKATTTKGYLGHEAEALPVARVLEILRRHGALHPARGGN